MSAGGALESSVTLDDVFGVLASKRVPLAPELAGYLILEIAERANPAAGAVEPRSIYLGQEGTVALVKPKGDVRSGDAEASVRGLLGRLLDASGTQTPALAAASKRKSGVGLPALAQELESALIPVNRAAGRRALARLAREVRRVTLGVGRNALSSGVDAASPRRPLSAPPAHAGEPLPPATDAASGSSAPVTSDDGREDEPTTAGRRTPQESASRTPVGDSGQPTTAQPTSGPPAEAASPANIDSLINQFGVQVEVDVHHTRALKAMAGLDPTPPPAPAWASSTPPPGWRAPAAADGRLSESDLRGIDSLLTQGTPPPHSETSPGHASTEPLLLRRTTNRTTPPPGRSERARRVLAPVVGLAVVATGALLVQKLRPTSSARALAGAASEAPAARAPNPSACRGSLVVSGVPPHAEVLLGEGQAPVDINKMPVGARLEFVATAEGYAPKRVVVPAGATWDPTPGGKPRFEAAVQLEPSAHAGTDPWPAGEPGSEVGGQGPPGTVRVVTSPRGAEVWMLAGIGPEARIDQLPCDHDLDVLVAGPTTLRKRLHVVTQEFRPEEASGPPIARVAIR